MNLWEVFAGGGGLLVLIMTFVQISKIQINPWSWLARKLGRAINGEIIEKVDNLSNDLNLLRVESEEREATTCRARIMRFGDEILQGKEHTKEHFDQTLLDITFYETYCDEHPKFRNSIAVATIANIRRVYDKCLKEKTFL